MTFVKFCLNIFEEKALTLFIRSKRYCTLLIDAFIVFYIIQNGPKMKKIWGFKLKRFKVFFSKCHSFKMLKLNYFFTALLHLQFKEVL